MSAWFNHNMTYYACGVVVKASDGQTSDQEIAITLPGSDSGQVIHTHVPLLPSSIIWYQPRGGDALQMGRDS